MDDDQLWDMPDEELEKAFKEAKAQENSPETELESNDPTNESEEVGEEEEEEILDGSDQPEEDLEESDHDASDEDEAEEPEEDNTEEGEEASPDGDAETPEEESPEDGKEVESKEQPAQSYSFRANGKDYEFSSDEIVDQFPKIFGQAMDYTKKMQTIKPWRKTIDAIEGAKLSHEDVSLMIDVLKGDKGAITEVLKRTGTDTLELDTEADSSYVAKDYGRNENDIAISDIVNEISKDAEYATTHSILSEQWDEASWSTIAKNPEMIRLLHTDVKSGMYSTLQPMVEKLKVFDGGSKPDLEYYKQAAQQYAQKMNQSRNQAPVVQETNTQTTEMAAREEKADRLNAAKSQAKKRAVTEKNATKRRAAAPTKSASSDRVVDYLDDSDESFNEWYKKLEG